MDQKLTITRVFQLYSSDAVVVLYLSSVYQKLLNSFVVFTKISEVEFDNQNILNKLVLSDK